MTKEDNNIDEEEFKIKLLPHDYTKYDLSFKIIIIGDCNVGKTCLSVKAAKNEFNELYSSTVGYEFFVLSARIADSNIKLQIWDTCGQEIYRSLINSFFRCTSLAIIVYSIENRNSFENLEQWLNQVKSESSPDVQIVLIGNKADLEDKRKVSKKEGEKFAQEHNFAFFMETSAKTGFNVQNLFVEIIKHLYKINLTLKNEKSVKSSMSSVSETDTKNIVVGSDYEEESVRKKKKCCF